MATSPFGSTSTPIDFGKPGVPTVQMYHGGTIYASSGGGQAKVIGRVTSWNPSGTYTREGVHIYELGATTWGIPIDYVPGRVTDFKVTFTRNEVWDEELELALGYGAVWHDLTMQNYPFVVDEHLYKGSNPYRQWQYQGCWFTEKTPQEWSAEGDGVIKVNCAMAYIKRTKTK